MRRKSLQTSQATACQVVDQCEYAVLSMCDGDMPYGVPVSIVRVGQTLYFHGAKRGKKANVLKRNSRVCVTCVSDARRVEEKLTEAFTSAIIFGTAELVEDEAEKRQALLALCQRHAPSNKNAARAVERGLAATAVWRIQIQEITGKQKQFDENGKPIPPKQTDAKSPDS